jgi:hypothetical protein
LIRILDLVVIAVKRRCPRDRVDEDGDLSAVLSAWTVKWEA